MSYGRNDCKVIDSGVFGSNETIFICAPFWKELSEGLRISWLQVCHSVSTSPSPISSEFPSPIRRGLGWGSFCPVCHSEASAEESTWLHVRILPPVWTAFHVAVQHSSALLGQEHPPHHHIYFTVSTIFSLYFEVVEKYFNADSSNHGEKLSMLSILSPQEWA